MARKSKKQKKEKKEHKKIKNIIQQVIVKIGSEEKRKGKGKRRRVPKKQEKEEINIMSTIPPVVVYQQAPSANIPQPFIQQPAQAFTQPVTKSLAEMATMTESEPVKRTIGIQESVKQRSIGLEPIKIKPQLVDVKGETISIPSTFIEPEPLPSQPTISPAQKVKKPRRTKAQMEEAKRLKEQRKIVEEVGIEEVGNEVTSVEFPPTANFLSEVDIQKSQQTPDKVYTEEPTNFKSEVAGNQIFGIDITQAETIPTVYGYALNQEQPMKVVATVPKDKGQLTMEQTYGLQPYEREDIETLETDIKIGATKGKSISQQKQPSALSELRTDYALRYGTIYDDTPEKKIIPANIMRQRLGIN